MNTTSADWAATGQSPTFQSPDHLHQMIQQLGNQYEIVKPSGLLELIPDSIILFIPRKINYNSAKGSRAIGLLIQGGV